MKSIITKSLSWLLGHKIISIIIVLLVVGGFFIFGKTNDDVSTDHVVVATGSIRERVSVTGNVRPVSEVDLAFERGGRVAVLPVSVGDRVFVGQTLASVSNADLLANVNQARANLKKAEASLGSNADIAALTLANSRTTLLNSIKDSYTKADDALRNKIYSLFNDPRRYNANLIFITDSFLQEDIEEGKDKANELLDSWDRSLRNISLESDLEFYYAEAKNNLAFIKNLLDKSAEAVNGLSYNSYSTNDVDTWKLNISTARTSLNSTIDTLTTHYNNFKSAGLSSLVSLKDTLAEEANIDAARAALQSAEAEFAKTIIRSPIDGVITNVPIKLGEIVATNIKAISVISFGQYEVESFVPEADISKVKIGNRASTTLDAYGNGIDFNTSVVKIDPAATVIDGVPTYKVTLRFEKEDERIRSGMTANLDILTAEKDNVLIVPARVVYSREGRRFVQILTPDGQTAEREVVVGIRGFDGNLEIISGLELGEKVSTSI